jgi:hypothetical protein
VPSIVVDRQPDSSLEVNVTDNELPVMDADVIRMVEKRCALMPTDQPSVSDAVPLVAVMTTLYVPAVLVVVKLLEALPLTTGQLVTPVPLTT